MKSPFAKYHTSGPAPGEELRRLADYVAAKREDGILIFCAGRMDNPEMMVELNKEHENNLRRQANLAERAANGR